MLKLAKPDLDPFANAAHRAPHGGPRPLALAALLCAMALSACGGGGGGGSTTTPPPPPPPPAASPFFLAAASGTQSNGGGGSINFASTMQGGVLAPTVQGTSPYALVGVDPTAGGTPTSVANGGNWLEMARLSQWTVSGANAANWGTRFVMYADSSGGLNLLDLTVPASATRPTTIASTALVALPGAITSSSVCPDVIVLDDYANAANSVFVFRNPGPVLPDCGSADDEFFPVLVGGGIQPGSSNSNAVMSWVEPVEAVRDASGKITSLLSIAHPASQSLYDPVTGAPQNPPTLQVSKADLSSPVVVTTPNALYPNGINGSGVNAKGGVRDFESLGTITVGANTYWFYRDLASIMVANVSAMTPSSVVAYPGSGSSIGPAQGPMVFDANNAYVAVNGTGGAIVAISLASLSGTPTATVLAPEPTANVNLAGITSTAAIYWLRDGSALRSVPLAGGTPSTLSTGAISGSIVLSATYGIAPPVVVSSGASGGVYFTVCDCAGFTAPPQAWFSNGSGSPTRVGGTSGTGVVLGGIVAASTPIASAAVSPTYSAAVIATNVTAVTAPSGFSYWGAALAEYGAGGSSTFTYGPLGVAPGGNVTFDTGALSPGVAQSGMPFLFLGSGANNSGNPTQDLWQFIPGRTGLTRLTTRLQ